MKEVTQEEPDRKTARSSPLLVKSSNSVVSEILKSLTNTKNKDYENMLTLSSLSPIGEPLEIPVFKGSALVIYNGQIYFLCVMRHEGLPAELKTAGHHILFMKTMVWLIPYSSACNLTFKVPHPLLSREDAVKQNIKCLTTCATHTHQKKASNEMHFSSHRMTAISQPKSWSFILKRNNCQERHSGTPILVLFGQQQSLVLISPTFCSLSSKRRRENGAYLFQVWVWVTGTEGISFHTRLISNCNASFNWALAIIHGQVLQC